DTNMRVQYDKTWYQHKVHGLDVPDSVIGWLNDTTSKTDLCDVYQLFDLKKSEKQFINEILDQRKSISKSIQYFHKEISRKQYSDSRLACEHGLISIYASNIILNILKLWSNNDRNLFPVKKLGDYLFIVKLLKLLDYHYTYRS
ncbi:unnamed protein product, partial [Rotaria sp. Silwood1]